MAKHVTQPNGRTWCPAYFNKNDGGEYRRTNNTWAGQTIFALDFDGGVSIDAVIERCKKYKVMPAFAYSTFSSVDNDKFRVVFQNSFEIQDIRVRNLVQLALMKLFKEADKACVDSSRMFYGGKEIIYHNYEACVDIAGLLLSVCEYLTDNDAKNYAKNIRGFCQTVGVNVLNGLPHIEIVAEDIENEKNTEMSAELYKYNRRARDSVQNINEQVVICFNDKFSETKAKALKKGKLAKVEIENHIKDRILIDHFDFEKLSKRCKLYSEILKWTYWAWNPGVFGLATNLLAVKGGETRFLKAIKENSNPYDVEKWKKTIKYIKKSLYKPSNCKSFCPFETDCEHSKNIIETVKLVRGRVNVVEPLITSALDVAEQKLKEAFEEAVTSSENKVFVIKAPTGIGKTELYLGLENTTIAAPRHDLKTEVATRMRVRHEVVPALSKSNEVLTAELKRLYERGDYWGASELKKEVAQHDSEVAEYLETIKRLKQVDCTLITTHERLMFTEDNNVQVVVDEDIIPTMMKMGKVDIEDIVRVSNKIEGFKNVVEIVKSKEDGVVNATDVKMFLSMLLMPDEKVEFLKSIKEINTNVVDFMNCSYWVKNADGTINYIVKRDLGKRKTIILSATANKFVYEKLFGDRLVFIDIGEVETRGEIIQYPQRSFSRYQLENGMKHLELARSIAGNQAVITFKKYEKSFRKCIAKFGAVTGIDEHSGQDMTIVGTPHLNPNVYLLYAAALCGEAFHDIGMNFMPIKRNGMEFYFYTFHNEMLREVQLYLIEAELIQAIGRARILRNDCTVTVLSNLAIPGAKFVYLDKSKIKELSEEVSEEPDKEKICESQKQT